MKKGIVLSLSALIATQVMGAKVETDGRVLEVTKSKKSVVDDNKQLGTLNVHLKAVTVVSDKNNGFAPSNGSGFLAKLKYESADLFTDGLKAAMGVYATGTAGLTEWDQNTQAQGYNKGAYGLATDVRGREKGVIGELYLSYKNKYVNAKLGRQTLDTPLTKIQISLVPNFYEAYMLDTDVVEGLKLTAGQITRMSFGSRALPDGGIIGEGTGTAGTNIDSRDFAAFNTGGQMEQGEFYNMGIAAGLDEETKGRTVLGATYSGVKNLKADFWLYHSDKIANDFYTELVYTVPVSETMKVDLSGQYLVQKDTGAALAGVKDFNMMGAKAALDAKKWGVFAAMNKSGDNDNAIAGQYFNAWGADPAYTSSIFSRNAYRTDVTAYKVGGHYVIMKGLKFMMNYANYGQSKSTLGNNLANTARTDAYELDTVLVYKPSAEWTFKAFHALRTSEFDGIASRPAGPGTDPISPERQMSHYRLMASYTF